MEKRQNLSSSSSSKKPEELSKKSFEVSVSLLSLETPKYHALYQSKHQLSSKTTLDNSSEVSSDSEDESGRPIFNSWNGKNHELQVLGNFSNDFEKNLKGFMEPKIVPLKMDPYCRTAVNYPPADMPIDDAYLLWERSGFENMLTKNAKKTKLNKPTSTTLPETTLDQPRGENEEFTEIFKNSEFESSSEDDDDLNVGGVVEVDDADSNSEAEEDILEYVKEQKKKRRHLENVTGEVFYYDSDDGVIRNLHKNGSISLTNYGNLHGDEKIFGNTKLLFDELSEEEKQMLKPVMETVSSVSLQTQQQEEFEKDEAVKKDSRSRVFAAGDY